MKTEPRMIRRKGMPKYLKERWLKALREPGRRQITSQLRGREVDGSFSYCCLGVLCDISTVGEWGTHDESLFGLLAVPEEYKKDGFREEDHHALPASLERFQPDEGSGPQSSGFPPWWVLAHWGLDGEDAQILASMNDRGYTFAEIADYIEEHL